MLYFVAESVFNPELPVSEEELKTVVIPAHEKHIARGIEEGRILLAGPKVSEGGGLMIVRAQSRGELDAFLALDPFVTGGIASFALKEFKLNDRSEYVKDW